MIISKYKSAVVVISYRNLSLNLITNLRAGTFDGLENLEVLDLTGNNVHDVDVDIFVSLLNLRDLKTNQYKLCCLSPHTNACFAGHDHISSCEHLIRSRGLDVTAWVLAVVSIVGNALTLIYYVTQKPTESSAFFCCNLAIADNLSGIYLIIISSANSYFKDRYYLEDERWRTHIACSLAGGLIVFSKMASLTIVVAIVSHMYVVSRLVTTRWKCTCNVLMMALCWLFALLCTVLPMRFQLDQIKDKETSAACSPFVDIIKKHGRWRHWFVLLVAIPTIMVVASIALLGLCCFVEAFYRTDKTKNNIKRPPEEQRTMKLIIATNSISWLAVAFVGIFCTAQDGLVVALLPWVVLLVVPLSSGLNPLIQLVAIAVRWFKRRRGVSGKKDEEGNSHTSADQVRWSLRGTCPAGGELGGAY
ncbi:G-protein coupled receptor GRL101-like [Branchiostoma floridae x Branchiostoma japonicum]